MEEKPSFDPKTIIAIILCMGIWFGWQKYLEKKYPQTDAPTQEALKQQTSDSETAVAKEPSSAILKTKSSPVEIENAPEKTWKYENDQWKVVVSSRGGRVSEAVLKKYIANNTAKNVELVTSEEPGFLSIAVEKGSEVIDFSGSNYSINQLSDQQIELSASKAGITVKKLFSFEPEKFAVKAQLELSGNVAGIKSINILNGMAPPQEEPQGFSFFGMARPAGGYQEYFVLYRGKKDREIVSQKSDIHKSFDQATLAALGSRYFTSLILNRSDVLFQVDMSKTSTESQLKVRVPVLNTNDSKISYNFDFFAGPKSIQVLKTLDETAAQVVDYGMFSFIANPLLQLMKWFYSIVGNWGVAIILLTILVRTLTFPFTYMSYKSMKGMQKLQPEIARLKEKHKGDTQTFNVEMMKLYRENKVSPMGGCLPTLLQLPVFWALYQVLQNSIELYHSPFFGWIHDLSQKDPYYVLPILMGLGMVLQQKLTPSTMDPAQAKMMMIMPIFFSFLMISLPSGLTLYIFVSTLFGIIQQLLIMKEKSAAVTTPRAATLERR